MKNTLEKLVKEIMANPSAFLKFLKSKFPVFHNSVFFLRDLQFGLEKYLKQNGIRVPYGELEKIAENFGRFLEEKEIFVKVNHAAWKINSAEFVTQIPGDPFQ